MSSLRTSRMANSTVMEFYPPSALAAMTALLQCYANAQPGLARCPTYKLLLPSQVSRD